MSAAEVPKPPDDQELRNIIDKLAQFVAKNGPDFENMTKQKQKENPRFSFLYGGENYHYYLYRVTVEQALTRKRQQVEQQQQSNVQQSKAQMFQAQIDESERNLKAQYDVLMKQQDNEINESIRVALEQQICQVAEELRLNILELAAILDGLTYPYSQDGQEVAINWILSHYSSPKHGELLVRYLLERVKDPREYVQRKLSILYLVGGLAQRSTREQNEHLLALVNRFAPIMSSFVMKMHGQHDERTRVELDQLIRFWVQQRLLGEVAEWRCANIEETITQYLNELKSEYADIVSNTTQRIQSQYRHYELQHHEYAKHIRQQIASEQQASGTVSAPSSQQQPSAAPSGGGTGPTQPRQRRSRFDDPGPVGTSGLAAGVQPLIRPTQPMPQSTISPWQQQPGRPPAAPGSSAIYNQPPPNLPPPGLHHVPPLGSLQPSWPSGNVPPSQAPWGPRPPLGQVGVQQQQSTMPFGPAMPPPVIGCISQPPPLIVDEKSLIPKVAYYDLPAGLMVPLIKMEDHAYEPLKSEDLRLPPPVPPNERLLAAMEAFYAPPSHEHPRDNDGWERLGLYEYYKEKAKATQLSLSKATKQLESTKSESTSGKDGQGKRRKSRFDSEEKRDAENSDEDHYEKSQGKGRRRTRSDSESPPGRRKKAKHRSRPSDSSDSRSDKNSSRSNSSSRSASRSPSPRGKKNERRARSGERRSRWNKEEDKNYPGHLSGREHQHGFGTAVSGGGPSAHQLVDPFDNFRRAQSAGFNQRLKSGFESRPR